MDNGPMDPGATDPGATDPGATDPGAPDPGPPTVDALYAAAAESVRALATRADPTAFQALLTLSRLVGEALGESARTLAAVRSWSEVGDYSGTTKQAAWSRWKA